MNTTISSDNNEQTQIQNNRIGTAGLVLVLMSFILFSFEGYIINSLNDKSLFFTLILPVLIGNLWLLGLIFSIIGLRINPKGRAIAGLIISLLPILFAAISTMSPQISTPIHFENELKERKHRSSNASRMSAPLSVRSEPNISVMPKISTNWRDFFMQIQPN